MTDRKNYLPPSADPVKSKNLKIGWGLDENQVMRHIKEVDRGAGCRCACPDCGNPLIARQGKVIAWHFAHAVPVECTGESILHLAAKQVLIDAAAEGDFFVMPNASGIVHVKDSVGRNHEATWEVIARESKLNTAEAEVRLSDKWIADAVVTDIHNKALAVEVFVTNKKDDDDQEKITKHKHDAVELDLSSLPWNISPKDLRQAVLVDAPRRFLYAEAIEKAKALAMDQARAKALAMDQARAKALAMDQARAKALAMDQARAKALAMDQARAKAEEFRVALERFKDKFYCNFLNKELPYIKGSAVGVNAFGDRITEESKGAVLFTGFASDWQRLPSGDWHAIGVINGKSNANILLTLNDSAPTPELPPFPVLVVNLLDTRVDATFSYRGYRAAWRNLGRWQEVINDRATKALEKSIARSEKHLLFEKKFRAMPEPERMRCIANKIGVLPPRETGDRLPAWNASWSVWKGVVWHYKISNNSSRPHSYYIHNLAEDKWLELLLGWPNDYISIKTRKENLWYWLRDLERLGYVKQMGYQQFRLHGENAPKGFIPWNPIK